VFKSDWGLKDDDDDDDDESIPFYSAAYILHTHTQKARNEG